MTVMTEPAAIPTFPTKMRGKFQGLMRRRATWVLGDQGVVSAGNYLTVLALARFLPKPELGAFGILLETMLYLNTLQAAIVIYPLTIKGATGQKSNLGRLATMAILFTLALLPILGGATYFSVRAIHSTSIAIAAIAAMLLWQIQETLRRAMISELRFSECVWGDAISYLGQAALLIILGRAGILTLNGAFAIIAVTSAAAIGLQAWQIGLQPVNRSHLRSVAHDFWKLGRWMLLSSTSAIVGWLGYWWTLEWKWGLEACAMFTACAQLLKLANPIINSMSNMITPAVARASTSSGMKSATRMALRYALFGAALISPFVLGLLIFPGTILHLAYGAKSPYLGLTLLLRLTVVNFIVGYIATMLSSWLVGLGHSRLHFYSQINNIVIALLIGLPLTAKFGVYGLIGGGIFMTTTTSILLMFLLRRAIRTGHVLHASPQTT
jgi:O-antigen/teichoic acid export membrane protein